MGAQSITEKGVKGEFFSALERSLAGHWVSDLALATGSDQALEQHVWIWGEPMREWVAGRFARAAREDGIGIRNRTFEGTIEAFLDEIRRDKTSQVMLRVRDLSARSVELWAKMIAELVSAGETETCYDGQPFFDPAHVRQQTSLDANPQSNRFTSPAASPTAPTGEEILAAVWVGIQAILTVVDYDLEHMNLGATRFTVFMPAGYAAAAGRAFNCPALIRREGRIVDVQASLGGGIIVRLVPMPSTWLGWTDRIAVFRADGDTAKAFIRQEEHITISESPAGGQTAFNEDKRLYGVSSSRGVGFGLWEHAALVQFT